MGNWPRFDGTKWVVFHCGEWIDAKQPPYIYDASVGKYYKVGELRVQVTDEITIAYKGK